MDRVIKRYLMHNQGDIDDLKLNEFDELKQELNMMKNEFINDVYKSKDDILKNVFFLTNSIKFIAEDVLLNQKNCESQSSSSHARYKNLMNLNETLLNSPILVCEEGEKNEIKASLDESMMNNKLESPPGRRKSAKKKIDFIDNLIDNTGSKSTATSSSSSSPSSSSSAQTVASNVLAKFGSHSKVSFDLNDSKFFPSPLYKIAEESTASAKSETK